MKKQLFLTLVTMLALWMLTGCSSNEGTFVDNGSSDVTEIKEIADQPVDMYVDNNEIIDEIPEDPANNEPQAFLTWHPNGARNRETPARCRLSRIRQDLGEATGNVDLYYRKFEHIFDECEEPLSRGATIGLMTELKLSRLRVNVTDNPLVQSVLVTFKNGEKLRGYLAMKPDNKKRPLIISRCGVFCDIIDRLPKIMVMQLFEETPFNLLVLASTTGLQYVDDNRSFGIGGYLEASQHLKVAEYLRSPASGVADKISNIHVMGASLGANSSLMTSVLAQANPLTDGRPAIASVFSLCPVVDLEATLDEVLKNTPRGFFMSINAWKVLKKLYANRGDAIPEKPPIRDIFGIVGKETQRKYKDIFSLAYFVHKPFEALTFSSVDEVWFSNRFTEHAMNTKIPSFVWTSHDDPIVPTKKNASVLLNLTKNSPETDVKTHIVPNGRHCAESIVYGWGTVTELFKQFFLDFDPEFKAQGQNLAVALNAQQFPVRLTRLEPTEYHFAQTWSLQNGADHFDLKFDIWSPQAMYNCEDTGPYSGFAGCFRSITIQVPVGKFDAESHIRVPQSEAEAQALTRWANVNLSVFGNDQKELNHSRALPATINWMNY